MKKNFKNRYRETEEFFSSEPTVNQKAWGLIHNFYHLVLTHMEKEGITRAELAGKIGKSRSYVSQLFSKTPNISLKKMVEIADAIGIDLYLGSPQLPGEVMDLYRQNNELASAKTAVAENKNRYNN